MNPPDVNQADRVEILIVEDSPTQAEKLRHLLEEQRYFVHMAANGQQALAAIQERKPTLVISDIVMPGMDGYALCQRVKSQEEFKHIPVVLLTSLASLQDVLKGLQCGADNFICKPFEDKYLLSRISHILTNRELRKREKMHLSVELEIAGKRHSISSDRQQILDMLISTAEEVVRANEQLETKQRELLHSHQTLYALYNMARELNEAMSQKEVAERALARAMDLPGVRAGWVALWEGESRFRIVGARGLPPYLQDASVWDGTCLCQRKLLAGELDQAANIIECERLQGANGDTCGLRYHASVPLRAGSQVLGVMNLAGPDEGMFADDALQLLHGVGSQLAVALERARLLEQLEELVEARTAALQREVSERRKTQEALQASEEQYRDLLENANDLIQSVAPDGRILYANRAWQETLGYGAEDFSRLSLFDIVHAEDREPCQDVFRRLWAGEAVGRVEFVFLSKLGKQITVEGSINCKFTDGSPVLTRAILRDTTETRLLEEQLQTAQKMEAIGRLAGGVAHDFNNLLMVIMGYAEMAVDKTTEDPQVHRSLLEIQKAADQASALTRQLLAFGRRQVLQPSVLNLNDIVQDATRMLRRLIGEDIELAQKLDPELGSTKLDPTQIHQVIMNLAINARDAMPRGGKLAIETRNVELDAAYAAVHFDIRPGHYVMLAVSDTGTGMDARTQARIFEPFFTTKEQGKGTGLGLSTVYGIVKQSAGHIWVYSELGTGTTFKVYFPRIFETLEKAQASIAQATSIRGSETILLVEDDAGVRELTRELLVGLGYAVLTAANGHEAVRISDTHPERIHLIITDVVMPKMNGRELVERVRPKRSDVKVLYMSGYTNNSIGDHGVLEPGLFLLEKPFSREALGRKVRELLGA